MYLNVFSLIYVLQIETRVCGHLYLTKITQNCKNLAWYITSWIFFIFMLAPTSHKFLLWSSRFSHSLIVYLPSVFLIKIKISRVYVYPGAFMELLILVINMHCQNIISADLLLEGREIF